MIVSGFLALAIAAGWPVGPDTPVPQRYKVDVVINQSVDLTPMGQGMMDSDINGTLWLAVTMSDTTGGKLAHVAIDSMTVTATGMMGAQLPQPMVEAAKGQFFHLYLVDGKPEGTPTLSVEGNLPMMLLGAPAVQALFLGVPAGKKVGDTWADTTNTNAAGAAAAGISGQSVVTWTVTGMEGNALVITGSSTGNVAGDQNGQQISGTVTGTTEATTPVGGPSVRAKVSTTQDMEVLVPQAPDVIRIKGTSTATVTSLP